MDRYVLVEYSSTLNAVICETFKSMQRIKLMSFDVSLHYIIFGASSGGIYIFKRKPCEFLRLIPSKEGPTIQVGISLNEKNLAVASSRGLVIIFENFFVDGNIRPLVYNEHEGNNITVMKWHGNDLYCGDDVGKVSVVAITSLLTKTIFQTPSTILMHLDSSITQIDTYKSYLLISTKTRTYLCNTEKEQFKQIGKKLRDGNFGACFSNDKIIQPLESYHPVGGGYKTIKEGEDFSSPLSDTTKIFCARPGSRLWEANFEGSVLVTYQFRHSFDQEPSDIVVIEDSPNATLHINKPNLERLISKKFNFGKIYPVFEKFILTHDASGLYFFEPEKSKLQFWSNTFTNIVDIRIIDSYIYIWRKGLQMNIVSLQSLENLLIATLVNRQYYLCSELCLYYSDDLSALMEKSEKIHVLAVLKTKLVEIEARDMLNRLQPIMDILEGCYKKQSSGIKLENGIVIENQYSFESSESNSSSYLPETVLTFNGEHFDDSQKLIKSSKDTNENGNINIGVDNNIMALYRQYVLNKTHKNVELTGTCKILTSLSFDNLLSHFKQFIEFVKEKDDDDATFWCQEQILKQIDKDHSIIDNINTNSLQYVIDSLVASTKRENLICLCNFPLPKAHTKKIDHYKLACKLFDHVDNKNEYLSNIPYLYKYKLKVNSLHEVMLNLPVITQFSDKEVFKEFTGMLTYDAWDEIIKLFVKLKKGYCLNCGNNIDIDDALTWSEFGLLMVESIGSKNAVRLLKHYSRFIPGGHLDARFYQSCIFTTTCNDQRLALNFMEKVVNSENSIEFGEMIGRFIQKRYLGNDLEVCNGKINFPTETCPVCDLPVNTSVLGETKKCDNGHSYHSICYTTNSTICNICIMNT
ncbi:WD40 repeat domain-containing protein pink isoform X1 [Leptinotarsa decemlineata]|uniref:WD40 repeat domain-containing protein pink isoform X1 n=2 Tax=Leptinotarsa decemlineata TaxID=7539 RepID=UPI003D30BEE5